MNKKRALTLKDLNSFKAVRGHFKVLNEVHYNRPFSPDVQDTPSDFSNIDPEIRKAMREGRAF